MQIFGNTGLNMVVLENKAASAAFWNLTFTKYITMIYGVKTEMLLAGELKVADDLIETVYLKY